MAAEKAQIRGGKKGCCQGGGATNPQEGADGLHLPEMWPATNEGDWPLAVFWPDVLSKRTSPNTKGRMAEAEGRGAESQESCHSVEVNTIPLMPVFFFFSIFLACIVKVHTISF